MSEPDRSQGMEQVLIQAMSEVLGESGARAVVTAARERRAQSGTASVVESRSSPDVAAASSLPPPISHQMEALEQIYGVPAGRGLALRVGRASFPYALRTHGDALGLTGTSFRLLPTPSKFRAFGMGLAKLFNRPGDERVRLEEQGSRLLLHIERCVLCSGRHSNECICLLAVGVAEESLYWLSGGKIFSVEEVACAAKGDPVCILQIDLNPLS
jgi:hypothetical protein